MNENQARRQSAARLVRLHGGPAEIGQRIAEQVQSYPPALQAASLPVKEINAPYSDHQINLFQSYFPAMLEEMRAAADALELPLQQLRYLAESYLPVGYCSHFTIPAGLSARQQPLLARNYEFSDSMDDLCLILLQPDQGYAHLSSNMLWFGRYDGMNEKGLVVTMSAGGIPVGKLQGFTPPQQDGFQFWVAIRAVLETCQNVQEGLELLRSIPLCGNPILLLLDSQGEQARVEILSSQIAVTRLDGTQSDSWLAACNHFQQLRAPQIPVLRQSYTRLDAISSFLDQEKEIDLESLQRFLDQPYPQGLSCNYYAQFFGTLQSMIFNPCERELSIRFGSAGLNPRRKLSMDDFPLDESMPVTFQDETADTSFWEMV